MIIMKSKICMTINFALIFLYQCCRSWSYRSSLQRYDRARRLFFDTSNSSMFIRIWFLPFRRALYWMRRFLILQLSLAQSLSHVKIFLNGIHGNIWRTPFIQFSKTSHSGSTDEISGLNKSLSLICQFYSFDTAWRIYLSCDVLLSWRTMIKSMLLPSCENVIVFRNTSMLHMHVQKSFRFVNLLSNPRKWHMIETARGLNLEKDDFPSRSKLTESRDHHFMSHVKGRTNLSQTSNECHFNEDGHDLYKKCCWRIYI